MGGLDFSAGGTTNQPRQLEQDHQRRWPLSSQLYDVGTGLENLEPLLDPRVVEHI